MFAGSSAPTGWLVCDGSAISRATYSALFAVIGTTYGAGNGSTTFNIPDLRGRAAIGTGQGSGLTSRTLAQAGGEETHILTTTEMPSHNHGGATTGGANLTHGHGIYDPGHGHSIYDPGHNHGINGSTGENDGTNNWENRETYDWPYDTMVTSTSTTGIGINGNYTGISVNNSGSLSHDHTISSQGSSGAHNNMMPFAVLNYIIKL
jgi:microcystin-dependent protein